jgi:hypothetical protein
MTIIKFPDSANIRGHGGSALSWHNANDDRKIVYPKDRSDIVEISPEAKMKFNEDNLIRLEKAKILKEAREYSKNLAEIMRFNEADLRKIYRLNKIIDVNNKILSKFYSENEDSVLRRLIDMPNV